jgi:hypothetical protein
MIENIILIVIGITTVVFSSALAKTSANFQGKFYHVTLKPGVIGFTRLMFVLVGILFTVVGILAMLDIIKFN